MKRVLPFVFPAAALLIVAFLAFRWYGQRTAQSDIASKLDEGVQIEELSETERSSVMRGAGDYKSVNLESAEPLDQPGVGQVRYEIADGKVKFSVFGTLPELEQGHYQVWLKDVNSEVVKKAFVLEYTKSGYTGSAAISQDVLPFEVLVTREMTDDDTPEDVVLRGVIEKE